VPFEHRRGHGTMCAYDALAIAPEATLLDFAALIGRVDHSAQETLRWMIAAYSYILFHWRTNPDPAKRMPYKSLVISNSWGIYHPSLDVPPGTTKRFIDNPDHPFRLLVWLLSQAGADIVFSSGNCGVECPAAACLQETVGTINGGAAYPEVLTVGGCTANDEIVGYSSLGPALPPFPKEKPDVVTYTHFDGSEAAGRKRPDTGTSAACPVAAGVIAAIRTKAPPAGKSPALVHQALRDTARKLGPANWAPDYGHGVLQPVAAARALGLVP